MWNPRGFTPLDERARAQNPEDFGQTGRRSSAPIRLIGPDFLGEFEQEGGKGGKNFLEVSLSDLPVFPSSCEFARVSTYSVL